MTQEKTTEDKLKDEIENALENWRKKEWHCCEDKNKGIKPCHYDLHGYDIKKSIMEFLEEEDYFKFILSKLKGELNESNIKLATYRKSY